MKLALLGSGIRTPLLIHGLAERRDALAIDEICLFDTDPDRLRTMTWFAGQVAADRGADFRVTGDADLRGAVGGADFIFSSIRVGQERARFLDERIALDLGVLGQETTGPGGFSMALRTIPVLLDYARVIEDAAPDAWYINFSNPAGLITQALTTTTSLRVVGICDTPSVMRASLARFLGCDERTVRLDYIGLNHLGWVRRVLVDGVDRLPALLDRYEDVRASDHQWAMFPAALVRSLGMLPNEYLYYFYLRDEAVRNILASGSTRGEQILQINDPLWLALHEDAARGDGNVALSRYVAAMSGRSGSYMARESGERLVTPSEDVQRSFFADESYAGLALDVMVAISTNTPTSLVLNVLNRGVLGELDTEDVIETTCSIDANGIQPYAQLPLPPVIRGLVESMKAYERLAVRAAIEGDREAAIMALAVHPLVMSWPLAEALLDRYLESHAALLPQFRGVRTRATA